METEDILIGIQEMKKNKNVSSHFKPIIEYTEEMAELMIRFKSTEDEDGRNRIKDLIDGCRENIEQQFPVACRNLNLPEDTLEELKRDLGSEKKRRVGGSRSMDKKKASRRARQMMQRICG